MVVFVSLSLVLKKKKRVKPSYPKPNPQNRRTLLNPINNPSYQPPPPITHPINSPYHPPTPPPPYHSPYQHHAVHTHSDQGQRECGRLRDRLHRPYFGRVLHHPIESQQDRAAAGGVRAGSRGGGEGRGGGQGRKG